MQCDRCGRESDVIITSVFNLDTLCPDCKEKEKQHADYARAARIESEEVRRGNLNYPGVGKPPDL